MNKQTLLDLVDEAVAELVALRADIDGGLVARIRDGYHGHPRSPSFDAGQSARPRPAETLPDELRGDLDYADPVGRVVAATGARDGAQHDAKTLLKAVTSVVRQARAARDVRSKYRVRHASLFDQQETREPEPGCVSCSRVPSPGSVGQPKAQRTSWWNPIAREVTLADGRKVGLCEWCRVQARATGSLPDLGDVEAHRDGRRVQRRSA